ncbi:class I SAM-dependent methyltransferase [Apilactobacillus apisilvae]|uniref:Class I SAM-dependent methyltransferase n=1 Tax=Apilactobacillus apisilvae TaxID=2923364 RepID=A0ABY4PHJ2_9LACO|nr:class I SAM-dependent methyltransferase [Apilactobacillus apisilvae]UQS85279.1 class I SAM-dependent methyltransferase [Apilactobacillus apisilvae]
MIYQKFAELYDELFDPTMYDKWLDFVKSNVNKSNDILDIACGTGRLISLMESEGYKISGMDISSDMLTMAENNFSNHNKNIQLIQGDMLNLSSFPNYDTITCFDDSLCYLDDILAVEKAFINVFNHLNENGKYLFDVITPYQTDVVYPGYMYNYHDDDRAFMWTSYVGDKPHSVEHDLSFFNYNYSIDAYDAFSELHHERTYDLNEYLKKLKNAGFENVNVYSDFGKEKISKDTTRWFFVCEKG